MRLETERCILRPFQESDLEALYDYAKNPKVGPMAGWMPHQSIEESAKILEMFIKNNETAILLKETKELIGSLGVFVDSCRNYSEARTIGYVLKEEMWGQGLMPEVVKRVIQSLFEEENIEVISIQHFAWNDQSRRVIEKCGLKKEGILRKGFKMPNGELQDCVIYSILKEEYTG